MTLGCDSYTVCFCAAATQKEAKDAVRKHMKPSDKVTKDLLVKIHTELAQGHAMGRCLGCVEDVEALMVDYTKGVWT